MDDCVRILVVTVLQGGCLRKECIGLGTPQEAVCWDSYSLTPGLPRPLCMRVHVCICVWSA